MPRTKNDWPVRKSVKKVTMPRTKNPLDNESVRTTDYHHRATMDYWIKWVQYGSSRIVQIYYGAVTVVFLV